MGHIARITGRIAIDPPISWGELDGSAFAWRPTVVANDLQFEVAETHVHTDEGLLIRREAVAIVGQDNECRGNSVEDELEEIVRLHGEGRTFTGRLDVRWPDFGSDEASELRFMVVNGVVRRFEPVVTWPAESE